MKLDSKQTIFPVAPAREISLGAAKFFKLGFNPDNLKLRRIFWLLRKLNQSILQNPINRPLISVTDSLNKASQMIMGDTTFKYIDNKLSRFRRSPIYPFSVQTLGDVKSIVKDKGLGSRLWKEESKNN